MQDLKLLRTQRNSLYRIVEEAGLSPASFSLETVKRIDDTGETYEAIRSELRDTSYFFELVLLDSGRFICGFSPGKSVVLQQYEAINWKRVMAFFNEWLSYVQRETAEPDLWETGQVHIKDFDSIVINDVVNSAFTVREFEAIQKTLDRLRSLLLSYTDNTKEESDLIGGRLRYLEDAARRQGRKDWAHTAIGVFMTIVTGLALAPDEAKAAWNLLREAVPNVLRMLSN